MVGGVISPVHDAYAKKELASASHRCAMLQLALQNSDWIRLSTWETRQNGWTKTRLSLQHHQNLLNSALFDSNNLNHALMEDLEWIPQSVRSSSDHTPIQIKLLCGADLLESFGTCDLWAEEDVCLLIDYTFDRSLYSAKKVTCKHHLYTCNSVYRSMRLLANMAWLSSLGKARTLISLYTIRIFFPDTW